VRTRRLQSSKRVPKRSGEYLFEIILRRYETRSTIMTSNRPLDDWGKLIGDVASATAILDRFLHHAEIIQITGKSYRLRQPGRPPSPQGEEKAPEADSEEGTAASKPARAPTGSPEGKRARPAAGSGASKPARAPTGSESVPVS
jgi:hypothetical protein